MLRSLGIAEATCYRWRRPLNVGSDRLKDLPGHPRRAWNRMRPQEEEAILKLAQEHPSLSPREVACSITDQGRFSVPESTVYGVLKRAGLVKPAQVLGFAASKEYRHKTSRPNQMWASDGAYLRLRHTVASPWHSQTNGKCERYHRTVKGQLRLVPYAAPSALRGAVAGFVDFQPPTATTRR